MAPPDMQRKTDGMAMLLAGDVVMVEGGVLHSFCLLRESANKHSSSSSSSSVSDDASSTAGRQAVLWRWGARDEAAALPALQAL